MHHLDFKKAKELPYLYINIYNRKAAIKSRFEARERSIKHEGSLMKTSLMEDSRNSQGPSQTLHSIDQSDILTGNGRDTLKFNSRHQ